MFPLVSFSFFLAVLSVGGQDLIVELDVGKVQGKTGVINNETEGRRVAKHSKTVPVKAWNGVKNTTAVPPACAPIDPTDPPVVYSEDCLYLNVFRPPGTVGSLWLLPVILLDHLQSATDGLPVLFVIHGGAFRSRKRDGLRGGRRASRQFDRKRSDPSSRFTTDWRSSDSRRPAMSSFPGISAIGTNWKP
ncbi:Carboxylic ester hydrolase [Aphelenchoides fujianensis]|nr:Carboxylic ester hydrolase [Aphelenchoides fujianensis]